MYSLSILPAHLTSFETWIARFFLLLCLATILPWLLLLTYDILLFLARLIAYELGFLGERRPRAPGLMERSDGRRRAWSFGSVGAGMGYGDEGREGEEEEVEEDENENENEHGGKRKGKAKGKGRGREEDADVDVDGDLEMTEEESRTIRSTDLWDAGTDSRFLAGGTVKKRR